MSSLEIPNEKIYCTIDPSRDLRRCTDYKREPYIEANNRNHVPEQIRRAFQPEENCVNCLHKGFKDNTEC
jgi:hypothetical protein